MGAGGVSLSSPSRREYLRVFEERRRFAAVGLPGLVASACVEVRGMDGRAVAREGAGDSTAPSPTGRSGAAPWGAMVCRESARARSSRPGPHERGARRSARPRRRAGHPTACGRAAASCSGSGVASRRRAGAGSVAGCTRWPGRSSRPTDPSFARARRSPRARTAPRPSPERNGPDRRAVAPGSRRSSAHRARSRRRAHSRPCACEPVLRSFDSRVFRGPWPAGIAP